VKVLFLDIDGVLNSHRTAIAFGGYPHEVTGYHREMFDEVALALVRGIVKASGSQIVLSSSWRLTHHHDLVGKHLDLPIVDRTPSLIGERGKEIKAWLDSHPQVKCYAIVDDDSDMLREQLPFFVKTSGFDGLRWDDACKLARLLGVDIYDVNHPRMREPAPKLAWES
jgi:hypothetical protein